MGCLLFHCLEATSTPIVAQYLVRGYHDGTDDWLCAEHNGLVLGITTYQLLECIALAGNVCSNRLDDDHADKIVLSLHLLVRSFEEYQGQCFADAGKVAVGQLAR